MYLILYKCNLLYYFILPNTRQCYLLKIFSDKDDCHSFVESMFSCFSSPIEIRSRSCTPINTVHNKGCALFVYLSVVFINGSGYIWGYSSHDIDRMKNVLMWCGEWWRYSSGDESCYWYFNIAVNLGCITIPFISISPMEGLLSWHKKNHTVLPYEMCYAMLYCIKITTINSVCHK
jgi:hypothetical protein